MNLKMQLLREGFNRLTEVLDCQHTKTFCENFLPLKQALFMSYYRKAVEGYKIAAVIS